MKEQETLAETMLMLKREGYKTEFVFDNNHLKDPDTGQTFTPGQVHLKQIFRFEGAVNPGDAAVLYALETEHGQKGTISDGYGVYADPDFSHFIAQAHDDAHSAPEG
jgi:hypothetical protein